MEEYLLHNLAELSERRAINLREEAMIWDILKRDLKREAKRKKNVVVSQPIQHEAPTTPLPDSKTPFEGRLFIRVKEAQKAMGIGQTSLYKEIKEGRLPVKKSGRSTLIALRDIQTWFDDL